MKTCLVTGGTGFIGRNLLKHLVAEGYKCYYTTRKSILSDLEPKECIPITVDFEKEWNCNDFPQRIDSIVHLAQSDDYRQFPETAKAVFKVNVESTIKLLDYCLAAQGKSFVYASSGGIYGGGIDAFEESFDRIVDMGDLNYYLGTKLCSEILSQSYQKHFTTTMMRLFFVYGPDQREDKLIPRMIKRIGDNQPIILSGESGIKINPIYVGDVTRAISSCLERPIAGKVNIAGNEVLSIKEIAEIIGKQLGKKPIFEKVTKEEKNLVGNISCMKQYLFIPKVDFVNGIRHSLESDSLECKSK